MVEHDKYKRILAKVLTAIFCKFAFNDGVMGSSPIMVTHRDVVQWVRTPKNTVFLVYRNEQQMIVKFHSKEEVAGSSPVVATKSVP